MMLWIEGLTALLIAAGVFVTSLFQLKPEHLGDDPHAVRLGAALQGLLLGCVVAFVMLPLRLTLVQGGVGAPPRIGLSWVVALGLIMAVRSGLIVRLPLIGRPFRAYRLASLRQSVSVAQARITRLEALNHPKTERTEAAP